MVEAATFTTHLARGLVPWVVMHLPSICRVAFCVPKSSMTKTSTTFLIWTMMVASFYNQPFRCFQKIFHPVKKNGRCHGGALSTRPWRTLREMPSVSRTRIKRRITTINQTMFEIGQMEVALAECNHHATRTVIRSTPGRKSTSTIVRLVLAIVTTHHPNSTNANFHPLKAPDTVSIL